MSELFIIKKPKYIITLIVVFLLGGLLTFIPLYFTGFILTDGSRQLSSSEFTEHKVFKERYYRINELRNFLADNFYLEIDDDTISTGILRGLFASPNDPYTMYYTKAELDAALATTNGEMSGLGVTLITNADNQIEVDSVIKDSPAEKIGILPGDVIISVNDILFNGTELEKAVEESHGDPGTKVKVSIFREGKMHDFEITRSNFIIPSVSSEVLPGNIGHISVSTFNQNTAIDFETALTEMENAGQIGVVIDLRNNNGGIVDQAIEMLDLLLDESVVVYSEDGQGNREPFETTNGKTSLPYVVLINEKSASAAEIFALGIKNLNEGRVIGTTTFGKGVIQKIMRFDEGDGARITAMQYLAPDGTPVHGIGVSPEIEVAPSTDGKTDSALEKGLEILKTKS